MLTTTPRQQFVARIQQYRQEVSDNCPQYPLSAEEEEILKRLSSDDRMYDAWKPLAELPLESFCWFIQGVLGAKTNAGLTRLHRVSRRRLLKNIARSRAALWPLRRALLDVKVSSFEAQLVSLCGPNGRYTVDLPEPDPLAYLDRIEEYLVGYEQQTRAEQIVVNQFISREASPGERAYFIWEVAQMTNRLFGKPRYELIAAVTNVVLDDGGDVSAELARNLARRANRRRKPEHSQA